MTQTARNAALVQILANASVCNEDGDDMESFEVLGRDALDFCSVHIAELERMLQLAYEAGRAAK